MLERLIKNFNLVGEIMVEEVKDIYKVFREGDYKSESKKALRSFFSPVENIKYIIKDIKKRVS